MLSILYSEVNTLCILIVLLVLYKVHRSADLRSRKVFFERVLLSTAAFFATDLVCITIDQKLMNWGVTANWIINTSYYVLIGVMGFTWFLYSESVQQSVLVKDRKSKILCMIPLCILCILLIVNFKTRILFYVDENNVYHRGELYALQAIVAYAYMLGTAAKAFFKALHTDSYSKRKEYFTLSSFVMLPIMFGVIQFFTPGVPIACIGITLGILSVYLDFQEQLISLDPLTQVNNRNHLKSYLVGKMQHAKEEQGLYLLMIDVDYFKKINDQYGHIEGDTALVRVANAIKQVCQGNNYFLARYGGDEFMIIGELEQESKVEALCRRLQAEVEKTSREANSPYTLTLSIGYAKYAKYIKTMQEFIAAADVELYKVKKART